MERISTWNLMILGILLVAGCGPRAGSSGQGPSRDGALGRTEAPIATKTQPGDAASPGEQPPDPCDGPAQAGAFAPHQTAAAGLDEACASLARPVFETASGPLTAPFEPAAYALCIEALGSGWSDAAGMDVEILQTELQKTHCAAAQLGVATAPESFPQLPQIAWGYDLCMASCTPDGEVCPVDLAKAEQCLDPAQLQEVWMQVYELGPMAGPEMLEAYGALLAITLDEEWLDAQHGQALDAVLEAGAVEDCGPPCRQQLAEVTPVFASWVAEVFGAPAGPLLSFDLSFPLHPRQKDCDELAQTLAQAKAQLAEIDCSELQAAFDKARAQADADAAEADAAAGAAKTAHQALAEAKAAHDAAQAEAQAAADALAGFLNSHIFHNGISVGGNPGGFPNSIGVGSSAGGGGLTIYFDGSQSSIDVLLYFFRSSQFQSLRKSLTAKQKAVKAAAEKLGEAEQADAEAQAEEAKAAARAAASGKLADALAAQLAECLKRKQAAQDEVDQAVQAVDDCKKAQEEDTSEAVGAAAGRVDDAEEAVEAAGSGLSDPGSTTAAQELLDQARDKLKEAQDAQAAGDLDEAQDRAEEAAALAEQAITTAIGCQPEGAVRETLKARGEEVTEVLVGFASVELYDWRGVHGLSHRGQEEVSSRLESAIKLLDLAGRLQQAAAAGTGQLVDLVAGVLESELQGTLTDAILNGIDELKALLKQKDPLYWVEFRFSGGWELRRTLRSDTYRRYVCTAGVWRYQGDFSRRVVTLGACVSTGGSTVVRHRFEVIGPPLAGAVPAALKALLRSHRWLVGACPGS